ncbi:MAG: response regulator [Bacteroidales bacterium]|jgi:two-component system LytT family response regulator|nr:response regulator [Bacteroidales bacterium]
MKINIIIIDDEKPARDILKYYLSDREDVNLIAECDNGFSAFKSIQDLRPDIIFLDVQMPKLTGFEMLDILDEKPEVIFTTAFDQYAIKAFEHNAVDYLLKPFEKERMIQALDKAINKLKMPVESRSKIPLGMADLDGENIQKIVVKKGNAIRILKPDEILYMTAEDDYVMFYTESDRYLKYTTMKYLEANLPNNFMRIHRSSIINLNCITEVQTYKKDCLTVKITSVPLKLGRY